LLRPLRSATSLASCVWVSGIRTPSVVGEMT
jgi:hypothetical protein